MMRTVKGIYEDGRVTLDEEVPGVKHAEVLVVFVDERPTDRMLERGMFRPADGHYTREEDFQEAKLSFEPKERPE
jgi:hypothetical protein